MRFIPARSLDLPPTVGPWPVAAVVFCERDDRAQASLDEIEASASIPRLMEQTFDSARLGPAAMKSLLTLAADADHFVARYRDAEGVSDLLGDAIAGPGRRREVVPMHEILASGKLGPHRDPRSMSWAIGRGVVIETADGQVVALGGSASVLWELLDGASTVDEVVTLLATGHAIPVPEMARDVGAALAELESLGLLVLDEGPNDAVYDRPS